MCHSQLDKDGNPIVNSRGESVWAKSEILATLARLRSSVWAMLPEAFAKVVGAAATITVEVGEAEPPEPEIVETAPACNMAKVPRLPKVSGQVAVIPVHGVIGQHGCSDCWAGVYTEDLEGQIGQTMANSSIGAVVLDIDSPGGIVYGTPELADMIRGLRGNGKPIYGVANAMAASAAYWIGSSADQLFVTPSGEVGSIGVWSGHLDMSRALEMEGLKVTLISAGKFKTEANPWEPLSEEAEANIQKDVDRYHAMFLAGVAASRGVSRKVVEATYGEGRLVGPKDALASGMVDGIATLPEVLAAILKPKQQGARRGALALDIALAEEES